MAATEPKALNGHTALESDAHRQQSKLVRRSILKTLSQAVALKDLAYETALELREKFDDDESADRARSRAMAVTSLVKAWVEAVDAIRIQRGKPLPGSRRPAPEVPRRRPRRTATLLALAEPGAEQPKNVLDTIPGIPPHTPPSPESPC